MRTDKWEMYMFALQGHPTICKAHHTVDTMKFICDLIPPSEFPKMLNIGAGEGLETKILKDLGYDVTGIIRGKPNLEFATRNYPDIKFVDTDMHDLPFSCDSFDAIYMNQVFEHAFAPFIFLLELYCVLKEGGRMWLGLPGFREIDDITAHKDINLINHHHPNILCINLFGQYFRKTGFEFISTSGDNYLLQKMPLSALHSDVQTAVNMRRQLFG
jgi:SAM-dependent methyltransferase